MDYANLVARLAYRGGIAVLDAPEGFAAFRVDDGVRVRAEILAHIGDLLGGSLYLLRGELVYLASSPRPRVEEVSRFFSAVQRFSGRARHVTRSSYRGTAANHRGASNKGMHPTRDTTALIYNQSCGRVSDAGR